MSTENVADFLIALLVIMVVALQVQIIKLNRKVADLSSSVAKK